MLQQQKEFQRGATPYLRGDADPTYLRKSTDKTVATAIVGATALGWVAMFWYHTKMWVGQKD